MQANLNRAKLAESLKELAEAGSPVDISVADTDDQHSDVEINQVGESIVFDLRFGGTGYLLDLEIINQTSKTIYCSAMALRRLWEDILFEWLPDPKENPRRLSYFRRKRNGHRELVHATSENYCFCGGSQLEYPREVVLNHVLLKRGILAPGRPLKGLLLASGGPMPGELRHGQILEPTLTLISSTHIEYTAPLCLGIDRSQAKPKPERRYTLREEPVGIETRTALSSVGQALPVTQLRSAG